MWMGAGSGLGRQSPRGTYQREMRADTAPRRPGHRPGGSMSSQPQRLIAALDLGSTKIVAVIAEVTGDARDPGAKILGLGVERSGGIRRGVVRDIEETTRAIDKAMKSAQRMAGVEVGAIYCGIAGEHVAGRSSPGMVSVTADEIRTNDVARVN